MIDACSAFNDLSITFARFTTIDAIE